MPNLYLNLQTKELSSSVQPLQIHRPFPSTQEDIVLQNAVVLMTEGFDGQAFLYTADNAMRDNYFTGNGYVYGLPLKNHSRTAAGVHHYELDVELLLRGSGPILPSLDTISPEVRFLLNYTGRDTSLTHVITVALDGNGNIADVDLSLMTMLENGHPIIRQLVLVNDQYGNLIGVCDRDELRSDSMHFVSLRSANEINADKNDGRIKVLDVRMAPLSGVWLDPIETIYDRLLAKCAPTTEQ